MSEIQEQLAELAHDQWSGWMEYLFGKCIDYEAGKVQAEEGAVVIPKWAVERWARQAGTKYCDLSSLEQDSDRAEADKFLAVFRTATAELQAELATAKEENELLNELVYAYESVHAPINPLLAENKRLRDAIAKMQPTATSFNSFATSSRQPSCTAFLVSYVSSSSIPNISCRDNHEPHPFSLSSRSYNLSAVSLTARPTCSRVICGL